MLAKARMHAQMKAIGVKTTVSWFGLRPLSEEVGGLVVFCHKV